MYTFKKNERLGSHRLQSLLFEQGKSFFQYPFRIQYLFLQKGELARNSSYQNTSAESHAFHYPAKCLISVSKRYHKKAVHRNKIKRLVREAYRKNKNTFYTFLERESYNAMVAFVYTAEKIFPYDEVEVAVKHALVKLEGKFKQVENRKTEQ